MRHSHLFGFTTDGETFRVRVFRKPLMPVRIKLGTIFTSFKVLETPFTSCRAWAPAAWLVSWAVLMDDEPCRRRQGRGCTWIAAGMAWSIKIRMSTSAAPLHASH